MKSRKNFIKGLAGALTLGWLFSGSETSQASDLDTEFSESGSKENTMVAQPLLGSIMLFAGNFAPRGWAFCNGQLVSISSNSALFALIGIQYGGDGRFSFGLPDLRGRAPIGPGIGPGLSEYVVGQRLGTETTTLTNANLPSHSHSLNGSSQPGTSNSPVNNVPAVNRDGILHYGAQADAGMSNAGVSNTGGGQPFNNIQPVLAIHYCIALEGVFPSSS